MNPQPQYLRSNVQVEPLFDHWYLWSHLIPPATAARNVTERHIKIMESYINAPQVHANAVANPKLLGGPFIDYAGKRVDEIKALRDKTKTDRSNLIELSGAIGELDTMLRASARGFSLHPLYNLIPNALRGYVELVYDLNNNPSFRLLEDLLYRSKYFDRSAQSLSLSIIQGDDRPFVLSTPRLPSANSVDLHIPYDSEIVDALFSLKHHAKPWNAIRDMFEVPPAQEPILCSMFTGDAPPPYQAYSGSGIRWRYFGHACILVEANGLSFLLDPALSYTYESNISRYTYEDLPEVIDFVLITHNHQDHVLFETLLQIRRRVRTLVVPRSGGAGLQDPSMKLLLKQVGFDNVVELREMESLNFTGGAITGVPFFGEHADLNIQSKLAYLIRIGQRSLLFAADSCNIEPTMYAHVQKEIGDVSAIFVGMECDGAPLTWLYGPLLTTRIERGMDESRRFAGSNCEQAVDIVKRFHCKEAYVYAMGQEPWLNYIMSIKYTEQSRPIVESNRFVDECRASGVWAERLFGEKEILIET